MQEVCTERVFLSTWRTVEAYDDARGLRRHLSLKQGFKSGYFHEEVSFRNRMFSIVWRRS
jgi:hypothetical protein